MTTRPAAATNRRIRGRCDEGSATVFLSITVLGLLVLIGLVVDGGAKIRGIQRADALAADAARVAGQRIDVPDAITGQDPTLDARAAAAAARAYLTARGVTGTVTTTGTTVTVTVTDSTPTVFLGLIGIHTLTVTGHASATLVPGITGATP
jgi:hypothetical protein